MRALTAKVTGRRYHDAPIETLSALTLRREYDNPMDPNAVTLVADGKVVGYLEQGLASLVAPLIDKGRPVLASPIKGRDREVNLFIPEPYERLSRAGHLINVRSSDGKRAYVVDTLHGGCTCPAGRFVHCRHQREVGAPAPTKQVAAAAAVAAA